MSCSCWKRWCHRYCGVFCSKRFSLEFRWCNVLVFTLCILLSVSYSLYLTLCTTLSAQTPQFVSEVNVFLDIVRVFKRLRRISPKALANIWDDATGLKESDMNLTRTSQLVNLCRLLGEKARDLGSTSTDDTDTCNINKDGNELVSLEKHARQCAHWILTNSKRKRFEFPFSIMNSLYLCIVFLHFFWYSFPRDLSKQIFLESSAFEEILLDYYWEFSEVEVE